MGQRSVQRYCTHCQIPVLAIKERPSHVLHLLLALITAGLWLIPWAFMSLPSTPRCTNCGSKKLTYGIPRGPVVQRTFSLATFFAILIGLAILTTLVQMK